MGTESDVLEQIAAGAWNRLRNLIVALDRVDRLETSEEYVGWLQTIAGDTAALQKTMEEFVLRALRLAAEPINWRILTELARGEEIATGDLSRGTGVGRVELVERLNELARAGLTVQALEGEHVEITGLGRGVIELVGAIYDRMKKVADGDHLLNPHVALPRPNSHVRLFKPG